MKCKKGFVVLQVSIFLGLLAFLGLILFDIQIDKKKFVDASVKTNEKVEEKELRVSKAINSFKNLVEASNLTEEEFIERYSNKSFVDFNTSVYYDVEKKLFAAKENTNYGKICIEYYDYKVELSSDDGIIKVVKLYKV